MVGAYLVVCFLSQKPGDSIRDLFIPRSLKFTNNLWKGHVFTIPKKLTENWHERVLLGENTQKQQNTSTRFVSPGLVGALCFETNKPDFFG